MDFALIGAAGFVAPRHMRAIRDVDGDLVAAVDPSDSVGVIDTYFPEARFFTEFERFDRHLDKLSRQGKGISYLSVCSPNYLHDAHVRYGLRTGADVICEKPLVLNPWNVDGIAEMERATGRHVSTIMQLRLHPTIVALRTRVAKGGGKVKHDVDLTYIASRGRWYDVSWKGDVHKSGGVATNIGVHFFDVLGFVFGELQENVVHLHEDRRAGGYLEFANARVRWFLSVDNRDLAAAAKQDGKTSYRSIIIDGEEVDFSTGFEDLHTASYREILAGRGFSLDEVRPSIETVSTIRSAVPEPGRGELHPLLHQDSRRDAR